MQRILNLKFKSLIWVFILTAAINIVSSNALIYFSYQNFIFPLIDKVSDFLLTKSNEESLEINLVKGGMLEANKEEFLISSEGFPIDLQTQNLIYISEKANLETLKSKNALLALSNNKVFSELDGEYFVVDIWEQFPDLEKISINPESVTRLDSWLNQNNNLIAAVLILINSFSTVLTLAVYFFIGYVVLRYIVISIFKLSNTVYSEINLKVVSMVFLCIYNVLDPVLRVISITFSLPFPDIISFIFFGFVFILSLSAKFPKLVQ